MSKLPHEHSWEVYLLFCSRSSLCGLLFCFTSLLLYPCSQGLIECWHRIFVQSDQTTRFHIFQRYFSFPLWPWWLIRQLHGLGLSELWESVDRLCSGNLRHREFLWQSCLWSNSCNPKFICIIHLNYFWVLLSMDWISSFSSSMFSWIFWIFLMTSKT